MKQEIPSRRVVLRGALAVGCGLVLPITLLGCDSKPAVVAPTAAPAAPPPAVKESAATSPAVTKVAQSAVQYQAQPKADQKCVDCMLFLAGTNTCQRVEGQISPEGWCLLWVKKA